MSIPQSKVEFIRGELKKDLSVSAQEVVKAGSKAGFEIDIQQVYQTRCDIRKKKLNSTKTRLDNEKTLSEHILQILNVNPNGLTDQELADAVKKSGYISRASDFYQVVRQKLYDMINKGVLVKKGSQYTLHPVHTYLPPDNQPNGSAKVDDYTLLRQAVVDFAKYKGFAEPEKFPDHLIRMAKAVKDAESMYSSLIATGTV